MDPNHSSSQSLLVLADIHFGQLADSQEFSLTGSGRAEGAISQERRREELVRTVKQLPDKPSAILVPGDLTSVASPAEFAGCMKVLNAIASDLAIPPKNIILTFGNHDTNWRICELRKAIGEIPEDPGYDHVAASLGRLYTPENHWEERGPVPGCGLFKVNDAQIFVLNSGIHCVASQTLRHGRVGHEQLEWIRDVLKRSQSTTTWKILMVHHHPFNYIYPRPVEDVSCIEEGAELVELAGQTGIDLVCHGHRHHPRLFTEMRTGWRHAVTFFCAGSLAVNSKHRSSGRIPNLFHVVGLQRRLNCGAAFGTVTSYEFSTDGWRAIRNCGETPLDHVHSFGPASSEAETKESLNGYMESLLTSNSTNSVILPKRADLPLPLQCCCLDSLNDRLITYATEHDLQIVGKYPETVAVLRRL